MESQRVEKDFHFHRKYSQILCQSIFISSSLGWVNFFSLCSYLKSFVFLPTAAKSLQLCLTLCDPIDSSPTGSPVPGILQARTLELVAISFSNAWKWSRPVVSDSSQPHGLRPTRLLRPQDFPGKSTGVGCHCLFFLIVLFFRFNFQAASVEVWCILFKINKEISLEIQCL